MENPAPDSDLLLRGAKQWVNREFPAEARIGAPTKFPPSAALVFAWTRGDNIQLSGRGKCEIADKEPYGTIGWFEGVDNDPIDKTGIANLKDGQKRFPALSHTRSVEGLQSSASENLARLIHLSEIEPKTRSKKLSGLSGENSSISKGD